MTVTIHYRTHKGTQAIVKVATAEEVSQKLETFFEAKIEARAIDDESKENIGNVWYFKGRLVWGCFV